MKRIIFFILFCLFFSIESFATENRWSAWDLDNPCVYHTGVRPDQKLSYRELLEKAKEFTSTEEGWHIVEKVTSLFSKPNGDFFPGGYARELPYDQWSDLDFSTAEFRSFREARKQLNVRFRRELSYALLGLKETEFAIKEKNQRDNFNPIMYELDHALQILERNSHHYIGSLT